MIADLVLQGLLLIALCTGLPLAAGAVAGLTLSIVQAATQVQEQTIGHVVRLAAVSVVLFIAGQWFVTLTTHYMQEVFNSLAMCGRISSW